MRKAYSTFTLRIRRSAGKAGRIPAKNRRYPGFTLIELLVVMAIIATLLSIVVPRYFNSLDRSKEVVLRQDLSIMRDAIDKFYSDTGKYPGELIELVEKRYLRAIPVDPLTESAATWVAVPPPRDGSGVYDVRSGSPEQAKDGTFYEAW
ncbi:type II secretion system protein G [Nitrosospira lacus]|uniref:Type II secretion system protein G n=1 Tax=Nitrosospira lacus TaxID=1288494 RepID=A0A1W6SM80_9PROT|nr:prepilin-type N-terminal cleavage/methylation domain-containing protein [Nitrosospira lacus]ARO86901.1 type II secretion system protein G [Nitrosospira lacus]